MHELLSAFYVESFQTKTRFLQTLFKLLREAPAGNTYKHFWLSYVVVQRRESCSKVGCFLCLAIDGIDVFRSTNSASG
jgi:hypothetical protein